MKIITTKTKLLYLIAVFLLFSNEAYSQTFYNMSSANYSQDFANIASWTDNYAAGTGAANFRVATNVTSSTVNTFTVFTSGTAGGVQKGTANLVLLAAGSNSAATDLLLNFTNRDAGTISLDWAQVSNSTSTRNSTLKIQYSDDNGATFTDLTGYTLPVIINNTASSGSINSVTLPSALNNKNQVVIRFYVWNNGSSAGTGTRPKFSIDNIVVTSSASAIVSAPEINLKQGSTDFLTSATYLFGNQIVGSSSTVTTFTIENTGDADLNVSSIVLSGTHLSQFALDITNSTGIIAAGSNKTFTLTFSPTTAGAKTARVTITNNDANEGSYILNLEGTATAATNSQETDVVAVANSETTSISSINNTIGPLTSTQGTQVWQISVREGGADLTDSDALPSIITALTLIQGTGNAVTNWGNAIQAISLFDGTTNVGNGIITATQIQFSSLNISVADGTAKTLSIRLTLKTNGFSDNQGFIFRLTNTNFTLSGSGSGKASFTAFSSTGGRNTINVVATQIRFLQQPTNVNKETNMTPLVTVQTTDINGNRDLNYSGTVSISSDGTLDLSPKTAVVSSGVATFSNILHTVAGTGFRLTAALSPFTNIVSNTFNIFDATTFKRGDIVILAVNTNGTTGDEMSFMSFVDLTTNTEIDITDNGYESPNAGRWGATEGTIRMKRSGATIPKGKVITLIMTGSTGKVSANFDIFVDGANDDANWIISELNSPSNGFNFNPQDDIWIMQGGVWANNGLNTENNATYTGGTILYGWTATGWGVGTSGTSEFSNLCPGMDCFNTDVKAILPIVNRGRVKYTGPITATNQRDWIARVSGDENWTGYSNNPNYDAAARNYKGGQTYTITPGGFESGKWAGSSGSDWFVCSNWSNLLVPQATTNVSIDAQANNPIISSAGAICNNLTIESTTGGVLTIDGAGTLNLKGNFTNNNTFAQNAGTITFDGILEQTIAGTSSIVFNKIVVDKTAGDLILLKNIVINDASGADLSLTSGDLDLNGFNIDLGTDASIQENLASNHIIKDNTATDDSSPGGYIRATNRSVNNGATDIAGLGLVLSDAASYPVSINRYHYRGGGTAIKRIYHLTGAPTATTLRINYAEDELAGVTESDLSMYRWRIATGWFNYTTVQTNDASANFVQVTGVDGFSAWTLGSITPLPIQLLSFNAKKHAPQTAKLTFQTASETNNMGFEIEKSSDGKQFAKIGFVDGAGNSSSIKNYQFLDNNFIQSAYYRLKQIDQNAKFAYSNMVFINQESSDGLSIYPNPVRESVRFLHTQDQQTQVRLQLYSIDGKLLFDKNASLTQAEAQLNNLVPRLAKGLYMLKLTTPQKSFAIKMLKD